MNSFEYIPAARDTRLFFFGDHAGRHIPPGYNNLGLSGRDLTRHIAWDIGTPQLIYALTKQFGCPGQLATMSRLVIDLNRDLGSPSLIPTRSDGTDIPGNQNISAAERKRRIDLYYQPYHKALKTHLSQMRDPLVVSVHSFTPKPDLGDERTVDIGLLVKSDIETAEGFIAQLSRHYPKARADFNVPYSAFELNHTIDADIMPLGLRHLAIEVNQAWLAAAADISRVAGMLEKCLRPLIL